MDDVLQSLENYGAERTAADIAFFTDNYEIIVARTMSAGGPKEYLGQRSDPCRFCGRTLADVKFSKVPHAIPELLGNRVLVSHYECDECNARFGTFEADLGAMTALERLAAQVRGKGGVPSAKTKQGKSRIDLREHGFQIQQYVGDEFLTLDEEAKTITLTISPQSFRPLGVYKALLKAAISILEESDVAALPEALSWLCRDGLTDGIVSDGLKFRCIKSFTPGPAPIRTTRAMVLRLRDETVSSQKYFFVVGIGNMTFQIALPCPAHDGRLLGQMISMRPVPIFAWLEPEAIKGPSQFRAVSLGSMRLLKAPASITFSFDSMVSHSVPDATAGDERIDEDGEVG